MKATELIGKLAIRNKPTERFGDRSYMDEPLRIVHATDNHVIVGFVDNFMHMSPTSILDDDWIDGWEDFAPLQEKIDEYTKWFNMKERKEKRICKSN